MPLEEITGRSIIELASTLPDRRHEATMLRIMKWDMMRRFIERPEGKIIINHIADRMTDLVGDIIAAAEDEDEREVIVHSHRLIAYESVLKELAGIADDGMKEEAKIKK